MNEFTVEIRIQIRGERGQGYSGGIGLSQDIQLKARDFMDLCQILGQFHELSKKLEAQSQVKR